jgi:hypothetical protein
MKNTPACKVLALSGAGLKVLKSCEYKVANKASGARLHWRAVAAAHSSKSRSWGVLVPPAHTPLDTLLRFVRSSVVQAFVVAVFSDGPAIVFHKLPAARLTLPASWNLHEVCVEQGKWNRQVGGAIVDCVQHFLNRSIHGVSTLQVGQSEHGYIPEFAEACELIKGMKKQEWLNLVATSKRALKTKNEEPVHRAVNTYRAELWEWLAADNLAKACIERVDDPKFYDYPLHFAPHVPEVRLYLFDTVEKRIMRMPFNRFVLTSLHFRRCLFLTGIARAGKTEKLPVGCCRSKLDQYGPGFMR